MPAPCAISAGVFLSTPSSQRATRAAAHGQHVDAISIHALFAEGDPCAPWAEPLTAISIHALFAEGDVSTRVICCRVKMISIHALFAEGDCTSAI